MEQISGFPKNLSYNLKRLQSSMVRNKIRISADKTSYNANERIVFNFPVGRMIDSRSIVMTAKCSTTAASGNYFGRGGLNSLVENLQITCNSRVLQSTQNYNYIWNLLADYSYFSPEQATKRLYENFDPSVSHTNVQGELDSVITVKHTNKTGADSYYFCISNWLGFLNSSCSCWNTNDLGQVQMIISLAPNGCLWLGTDTTAGATASATPSTYKVEEATLCMDTISFQNSLYLDLVKSQLEGNGLNIAYNDYLVSTGSLTDKTTTGFTHTAQFSTNSLDQVIATFRPESYDTNLPLILGDAEIASGASRKGSAKGYQEIVNTSSYASVEGKYGGFNNSYYYIRDGGGIDFSSWYINSQPMTANSTPIEIFNNTLQALDYLSLDVGAAGLHQGALTSGFYNRCYFADILSLENISGDGHNWISGLSSNGSVISVQYSARFKSGGTYVKFYPVIIAKVSKVLNIKIGRNLDLME